MQITTQDLTMIIQIIDASAEKGIFKGPDLTAVGMLRARLAETITAASKQQEGQTNEPVSK